MKSRNGYAALFFLAVALGSSILAWKQYQELVELRVGALQPAERSDLQARIQELEQRCREFALQLAAARATPGAQSPTPAPGTRSVAGERGPGGRGGPGSGGRGGPGGEAARALMDTPKAQALRAVQQKAALDSRYAALFKNLHLPPEQLEKFKTLLSERESTMMDVMAVAREQGIDPRSDPEAFRKLLSTVQADLDNTIKATLGDDAFAQYQAYEQTQPQRNVLSQLEQRLSYTDSPLTATQSDQLLQILAATSATSPASAAGGPPPGRGGFRPGGAGGAPTATISEATVTQAQTVLNPAQVAALQQLQQQQQAQQQLQQLMSDTTKAPAAGTGGSVGGKRPGNG
jgi:hypothetical protein